MKERPIIFSGEDVRAILDDRKTKTRRVIKPQAWSYLNDVLGQRQIYARSSPEDFGDPTPIRCPYGNPDDHLWVRETWAKIYDTEEGEEEKGPFHFEYKASADFKYPGGWSDDEGDNPDCAKWKPSIHMPRSAARLILEVESVRADRLQEISEEDALAEGFSIGHSLYDSSLPLVRGMFAQLWDSINAKRGYPWKSNCWVWIIGFRRKV